MRIALVVSGGFDRSGRDRVIPSLLWLVERLARSHSLHVFVLRHYSEACTYQLRGATVHDLGRATWPSGLGMVQQTMRLVRALKRAGPFDVLHAYWAVPAGLAASVAGRRLGTPALVTLDSGELVSLPDVNYGLQRRWQSRLAVTLTGRLASRLTVCTEYMEGLARRAGLTVDRIPLGVDRHLFYALTPPTPGPPWRLLHVASLNQVKDQVTLLAAFARVCDRLSDVHLDVVGDDTLGGALQQRAADLGLGSRVTFHGFQPVDRLPEFYRRAHLLVMSSKHEAAGEVVLEAAACRLATAGTQVGYVADWAPAAAVAAPVGDAAALSDAIVTLLSENTRRATMAGEAERRALACDADWTASAFERLYAQLGDARS